MEEERKKRFKLYTYNAKSMALTIRSFTLTSYIYIFKNIYIQSMTTLVFPFSLFCDFYVLTWICISVPAPGRPPTTSLKIERFVRPFTLNALKDMLAEFGTRVDFWMDQIKTHCYITVWNCLHGICVRCIFI